MKEHKNYKIAFITLDKQMKKEKNNRMRIEKWEVEVSSQDTIDKVINYAEWCKYVDPQDDNERGFNRGIDRVMHMISNYIETF